MKYCQHCGKELNDDVKFCPSCGGQAMETACDPAPVAADPSSVEPSPAEPSPAGNMEMVAPSTPTEETAAAQEKRFCPSCGGELQPGWLQCPACGQAINRDDGRVPAAEAAPVRPAGKSSRKKPVKTIAIAATSLVVVAAIVVSVIVVRQYNIKKDNQYLHIAEQAYRSMVSGTITAEDCCNLIVSVWYNAIWEKADSETDEYTRPDGYFVSDFNDALINLFADENFINQTDYIELTRDRVDGYMKRLANPKDKFKDMYDDLRECYSSYSALTNMALNPEGSFNSFSEDFSVADKEAAKELKAMQPYFD